MREFIIKLIKKLNLLLCLITLSFGINTDGLLAEETCSRIAVINGQEVLVDASSSKKGEGLRFHLEKDEVAKSYLDTYQSHSSLAWPSTAIGTVGTSLIIGGIVLGGSNKSKRNGPLLSGIGLLILNFLTAKTIEKANEEHLHRAIEEYNLRNLPRIHYNPIDDNPKKALNIGVQKSWSF